MKKISCLLIMLSLIGTSSAYADEVLFSCTNKQGKVVKVIANGNVLHYSFGKVNQPDITISKPRNQVIYKAWNGIGSFDHDTLTFTNGQYSYEVFSGVQRTTSQRDAGVHVSRGETYINTVVCNPNLKIVDTFRQ